VGEVVALSVAHPQVLPDKGAVFADPRGDGRSLRVSWHADEGLVVLSLWQYGRCTGTFRMETADLPDMLRALTDGPLGR
jgi:hypothetical protein